MTSNEFVTVFFDRFADAGPFGAFSILGLAAPACSSTMVSFVSVYLSLPGSVDIYLLSSTWDHF